MLRNHKGDKGFGGNEEMKDDNEIIQTESMKGQKCPFVKNKMLFCQEGYCRDCQIYLNYFENVRAEGRLSTLTPEWLRKQEEENEAKWLKREVA